LPNKYAIFSNSLKRTSDFSARWGGEEFVILLPNTPLTGAIEVAEQIRADIAGTVIPCACGSTIQMTISIGIHSLIPTKDCVLDKFIVNADRALYAAKQGGRNRVVPAPSMET